MESITKISDVSKALGVPASTLRYWDKQGLLRFERNDDNNYRQFSFETMVDICDIILFRELEVPLYILKQREDMTMDDLSDLFSETKKDFTATIEHLQLVIERISAREEKLARLIQLKSEKPTIQRKKMSPIHSFDFTNRELVQSYLQDPTQSADMLTERDYICGIFSETVDSPLLREVDKIEKNYLHALTWTSKEVAPSIDNILKQEGISKNDIGEVIFQYLTSLNEDDMYKDYFEVLIELPKSSV